MNTDPSPHPGEHLFRHSLVMILATGIGHLGNYVYHVIAGRMLSENEYGLLMALFGAIHVILLPMGALRIALSRAVANGEQKDATARLFRLWSRRLLAASVGLAGLALLLAPRVRAGLGFDRLAPVMLAACIPALNLFLMLTGAGLQGLQRFSLLALRGGVLFGVRALLVGLCLGLGFRAAGWALLAHLLGMAAALALSLWGLRTHLRVSAAGTDPKALPPPPVSRNALTALPVLAAFAVLMSVDVLLVRTWFPADVSGRFAQAATLGRMILWLPLPIAAAMFPKVVRSGAGSSQHRKTALQAVALTLGLTASALIAAWFLAPLGFQWVYGIPHPPAEQIHWLRQVALAMVPLAPLHVWIHYELARGSIRRLWPILAGAVLFLTLATFNHTGILHILRALQVSTTLALLGSLLLLCRAPGLKNTSAQQTTPGPKGRRTT